MNFKNTVQKRNEYLTDSWECEKMLKKPFEEYKIVKSHNNNKKSFSFSFWG